MAKIRDKLYELVGTVIKIKTPILTGTATMLRTESFLVIQAYPHHILCERWCENDYIVRESFDVGTLVHEGILDRTVNHEYRKHFSNGWGC